jgi:hypothetical protein
MHETGYPQRKRAADEAKFRPRTADRTELFFTHALRSVQNGCNGSIDRSQLRSTQIKLSHLLNAPLRLRPRHLFPGLQVTSKSG